MNYARRGLDENCCPVVGSDCLLQKLLANALILLIQGSDASPSGAAVDSAFDSVAPTKVLPHPASVLGNHQLTFVTTEGFPELRHVHHRTNGAVSSRRVRVNGNKHPCVLAAIHYDKLGYPDEWKDCSSIVIKRDD